MVTANTQQPLTLGQLIVQAIESYPERVALVDGERSLSYRQLGERIAAACRVFQVAGMRRGDVVAQLSSNRIEMFCAMAAAYVGGFTSVTLHPMAGVADHAAIVKDCGARILISERAYEERVRGLRIQCPTVQSWYSHDQDDAALLAFWPDEVPAGTAALTAAGEPEDILRLAYTGGTTGRAKGVMLSSRAMLENTRLWLAGLDWPDAPRTLCSAPISHGAGSLIYPTLARGGTVFLQHGFSVPDWIDAVQRHRIQFTFIVPTMLYALLDAPQASKERLASLRALIYGAAPAAPVRIRHALQRWGNVLVQTYGQTEAPNTILLLDQRAHACATDAELGAAGRPFPGVEVELLDEDDRPVAPGGIGEICVRGPLLMSGYHGQPQQSAETLRGGWLHTGDLARRDAQGLLHIVDRKKDMIITGGFNVYPREVEDVLAAHPAVAAVAVIGVPDLKWGEAVKAVVVARAGTAPTASALIDYVRERKGAIHTPKSVDFVDQVPLTGLGKPDKKTLRQRYWSEQDKEIA
ncbi:MAG: acyl-CoA synthetase [Variovorax paradoxus]|uniref:Acyl-CoA synthetase n=1 Tax=Variovorax paradoxus TaxID=34073 RepID=A0A2W5QM99_VARPD|nr:MAG: acyl-CoA synthetase [Variovorax paradoxus]